MNEIHGLAEVVLAVQVLERLEAFYIDDPDGNEVQLVRNTG